MSSDGLNSTLKPSPSSASESEDYLQALYMATVLENRWLPQKPTAKQAKFLYYTKREALFGGSAGGGKSSSLLMGALQFVDVPGYAALVLRKTYADLSLPGALMDRSHEWLRGTEAKWNGTEKTWTFPSGATLTFGYLDQKDDHFRYASSEFQAIYFDELTQFGELQYRFLFSRLRRLKNSKVPIRMRAASNPGGIGHEWVKQRFLVEHADDRRFFPASLDDNPYLDKEEYIRSLSQLDPVTRAQLLSGDWNARHGGGMFKREWFQFAEDVPPGLKKVRYWDLAATSAKPGTDPDWTVGVLLGRTKENLWYVLDVRRIRATPAGVENLVKVTAGMDGQDTPIVMEQEPGSSGLGAVDRYRRHVLQGYAFYGDRPTGDKATRAAPFASVAEAGNVTLVRGDWCSAFLDELEAFPHGSHDDQVDGASGAFGWLARHAAQSYDGPLILNAPWPPTQSNPEDAKKREPSRPQGQQTAQERLRELLSSVKDDEDD